MNKNINNMTKEEFKSLNVGSKVIYYGNTYVVIKLYPLSEIIIGKGITETETLMRYENCELVETDKLVEYFHQNCISRKSNEDKAKEIRSIVRKEVIDGLKFPSVEDYYREWMSNPSPKASIQWFIEQVKTLNKCQQQ